MGPRRVSLGGISAGCVVVLVCGTLAFGAGGAAAAVTPLPRSGSLPAAGRGSQLTLSQAPAGLQAAVRRVLGVHPMLGASPPQQAELTASDAAAGAQFGSSVAISGSTAVVGAPFTNSSAGAGSGAAYVFVRVGNSWLQQAELTAS